MSTSPGPGVGIGTSSIVKGLPNACTTPAFIVLAMLASPIPLRARARLGWPHLDHLVLNTQLIAGAHWVRPAKFVEAGAHDATSGLELALDQEPHGERRRVPTARRQSAEDAVTGGIVIEMERLRIELGSEALDPITLDADVTGTVGLADGKILEVPRGHFDAPTNNNAASCPRHDQLNLPNQAPPATATATISPKAASATACATNTSKRLALHRIASHPPPAAMINRVRFASSGHNRRPAPCDAK